MTFASGAFPLFLLAVYFAYNLLGGARDTRDRVVRAAALLVLGDVVYALCVRAPGSLWDPLGGVMLAALTSTPVPAGALGKYALGAAVYALSVWAGARTPHDGSARGGERRAYVFAAGLAVLGAGVFVGARTGTLASLSAGLGRVGHLAWLAAWGFAVGSAARSDGGARARQLVLFLASAGFYHAWAVGMPGAYKYLLGLILATVVLDYFLARWIDAIERPAPRRAMLIASLVANLGVLATFKYFDFFGLSLRSLAGVFGARVPFEPIALILPAGISFHTFQSLSYTIDVYRRKLRPTTSVLEFGTFVLFFPQLVAGPIVRAEEFLPQIAHPPRERDDDAAYGLYRIGVGLAKKVLLADVLAVTLVDRVFADPRAYSGAENALAIYGYAFQIYLDFSAYSDIAVGCAALLGFTLPENFRAPYLAGDLSDFWRRWHITLSSWLRDYLYIPLGGSRGGAWLTYRNLLITMLLGGLWHGASWSFVAWGALHGVGLAVTRAVQRRGEGAPPREGVRWIGALLTFHYVCFAWVFFRAPTFARAGQVLAQLRAGGLDVVNVPREFVLALACAALSHLVPDAWFERAGRGFVGLPPWLRGAVLVGLALGLYQASRPVAVPFIYFQF